VKNKRTEFFQRRLGTLNYGKDIVLVMGSINSKALEASYLLSLRIAKTGKPHSIGENLLFPAIKDVVKTMFGTKLLKYIDLIPLSNDTVGRRIHFISVTRSRTVSRTPWTGDQLVARPLLNAPGDCEDGEVGEMNGFGRGSRSTRRKPARTPLCPPQMPLARPSDHPLQLWRGLSSTIYLLLLHEVMGPVI
jgi:hypothetical protein